jgi:hypothetical protein
LDYVGRDYIDNDDNYCDNNNNNNNNKAVETDQRIKVNISWDQQVQPDRTISNNKPDIIIHDKVIMKREHVC